MSPNHASIFRGEEGRKTWQIDRLRYCATFGRFSTARRKAANATMNWKGGRTELRGWIRVRQVGHPRASKQGKYVFEHILIMERKLGRYLEPSECVHHINGNRADNRIENLELHTKSSHAKAHGLSGRWQKGKTKPLETRLKISDAIRRWWAKRKETALGQTTR